MQQLLTEPLSFQGKAITLYTLADLFSVRHFLEASHEVGSVGLIILGLFQFACFISLPSTRIKEKLQPSIEFVTGTPFPSQ